MKTHTRIKRKYGLTTSNRHRFFFSKIAQAINGPKTFSSKEAADAYAKKHDIKNYELVPAKKNKKFKIVEL